MKHPIAWHEECLKNWNESIKKEAGHISKLLDAHRNSVREFEQYKEQIALAKKRGLTEFDQDRFGKKRSKG